MEPIPIENELKAFKEHLDINERTIFSAKFGDGKTFFLNEFKKKYGDSYEFITIYPVNYQIADNKEVFEYIKRDILIQMVSKKMIEPSYEIPDSLIFQFFIMQNSDSFLGNLLKILPSLGVPEQTASLFLAGYHALNWSEKMTKKYKEYKDSIHSQDENQIIATFLESFSKRIGSPYEIDLITQIIIDNIQWFRKSNNKTVILIIEDLDRMDPAHLFRILNIFSAHIDRVYQYQNSSTQKEEDTTYSELLPNKFGFDNIIIVFDYDTTKNIFHHFYGQNANYNGYINKFINQIPFSYSIKRTAKNYLINYITKECNISENSISNGVIKRVYSAIDNLSVRDIQQIIHNSRKYIINKEISLNNESIITDSTLTRFISILTLLGFNKSDIVHIIRNNLYDLDRLRVIGTFMLFQITNNDFTIHYNDKLYSLNRNKDNNGIITSLNINIISGFAKTRLTHTMIENCINKGFEYIKGIY
nr:MAG TPA: KAP family P-loop domain [Caudoviricetes sp.]